MKGSPKGPYRLVILGGFASAFIASCLVALAILLMVIYEAIHDAYIAPGPERVAFGGVLLAFFLGAIYAAIWAGPFGFAAGILGTSLLIRRTRANISGEKLYFETAGLGALIGAGAPFGLFLANLIYAMLEGKVWPEFHVDTSLFWVMLVCAILGIICALLTTRFVLKKSLPSTA